MMYNCIQVRAIEGILRLEFAGHLLTNLCQIIWLQILYCVDIDMPVHACLSSFKYGSNKLEGCAGVE